MTPTDRIAYQLPNGQIIWLAYDLCRAASLITYTLQGGQIVDAIILRGMR